MIFLDIKGTTKTLFSLREDNEPEPKWVNRSPLPSPTTNSSIPSYGAWRDKLLRFAVTWWEAPLSRSHGEEVDAAERLTVFAWGFCVLRFGGGWMFWVGGVALGNFWLDRGQCATTCPCSRHHWWASRVVLQTRWWCPVHLRSRWLIGRSHQDLQELCQFSPHAQWAYQGQPIGQHMPWVFA